MSPGYLRAARSEVIPQIPALAPQLIENPNVIEQAVLASLDRQGAGDDVPAIDLNKTERHAIAGFLIGEQREVLVDGEGREAQFRGFHQFSPVKDFMAGGWASVRPSAHGKFYTPRNEATFDVCLQKTLQAGAHEVRSIYSDGESPEQQWYPLAAQRYRKLGKRAMSISPPRTIPNEGRALYFAMRTRALVSTLPIHLRFINDRVKEPKDRVAAAHDLAQLLLTYGSLHVHELKKSGHLVQSAAEVERGDDGVFRVTYPAGAKRNDVFTRIEDLPNARMKCPAHSAQMGDPTADTNLTYFVHAAINAAAEHELI